MIIISGLFVFCGFVLLVIEIDGQRMFFVPGCILLGGGLISLVVGPTDLQCNVLGGIFAGLAGWVFYIDDVKHLHLPRWLMVIAGVVLGVGLLCAIAQPFPPLR